MEARSPRGPAARQAMGQLYNVGLFGCEINKGEETRPTSVVPFLVSSYVGRFCLSSGITFVII